MKKRALPRALSFMSLEKTESTTVRPALVEGLLQILIPFDYLQKRFDGACPREGGDSTQTDHRSFPIN
jgi:hypothetical protein